MDQINKNFMLPFNIIQNKYHYYKQSNVLLQLCFQNGQMSHPLPDSNTIPLENLSGLNSKFQAIYLESELDFKYSSEPPKCSQF